MSRPIVITVCIDSSSESWELYQPPLPWHSRAGGGAVHSIKSGHSHCSKKVPLFDHLVGGDQQFIRDAEAERLDAAEVDHQVELGRAVHAKRGRHSASMSVRSATEIRPSMPG